MTRRTFLLLVVISALACAVWTRAAPGKTHKLTTVSLRKMADSLHALIAADQRALLERTAAASAGPSHAAVLRAAAQDIQKHGAEFSYTLRSLWAIDTNQGPQTQVEQDGLEFVAKHPDEGFYAEEELGGRSYFTAVYASRATLPSCVECHNRHERSPRRDFKPGDVMGAVVVRVPLEF